MELLVQDQVKKEIQKLADRYNKPVHIVRIIEVTSLLIATIGTLSFVVISILSPDAFMGTVRGKVQKNYDVLFLLAGCFMSMLLGFWILVRTLRKKLSSLNIGERLDETLEIQNDVLFYTFRIKYQSLPTDRNVIAFNIRELEEVIYDKNSRKLTINGQMYEEYVTGVGKIKELDISERYKRKLILYDYFAPSLLSELQKYNLKIMYKG